MRRRIVECVANFSEGRDPGVVSAIAGAIRSQPGVAVLHQTMDPDHHRSVITFAGTPEDVLPGALRAVVKAAELIDITWHSGVHPRLGAADVVPLVPVENITLDECAALSHQLGQAIVDTTGIPVYFYAAAARRPERVRLEAVRRGGFEGMGAAIPTDPSRAPDLGGPALHPTAGAVIVGARRFLVAWNVNLATTDLGIAKAIARTIRESSGGFPHVKALGLPLESRALVQVSMNLTDFEVTPLHDVFDAIRIEASKAGVAIAGTEIIGLLPRAVLESAAAHYLRLENFSTAAVLESAIETGLAALD